MTQRDAALTDAVARVAHVHRFAIEAARQAVHAVHTSGQQVSGKVHTPDLKSAIKCACAQAGVEVGRHVGWQLCR